MSAEGVGRPGQPKTAVAARRQAVTAVGSALSAGDPLDRCVRTSAHGRSELP